MNAVVGWDWAEVAHTSTTGSLEEPNPESFDRIRVHDLLAQLRDLDHEITELRADRAILLERYDSRLRRLGEHVDKIRGWIAVWVERCNDGKKASFPDVGVAFLRKAKPALRVVDGAAFRAWAGESGFVKPVADEAAAKKAALETGEIPPGCELLPERHELTVKTV